MIVDAGYSMDINKSAKISTGAVMKNREMLKFVPDHLKLKECVNMQLKNYLLWQDMLLINIRLNKCVMKQFQKMAKH